MAEEEGEQELSLIHISYEEMRQSADPDATLLGFLQKTYDAAAECGKWDRGALEVATQRSDERIA